VLDTARIKKISKGLTIGLLLILALLATGTVDSSASEVRGSSSQLSEILRQRLEANGIPAEMTLDGELILAARALPEFYLQRFFEPVWVQDSCVRKEAFAFFDLLQQVGSDGLDPQHYHLQALLGLMPRITLENPDPGHLVDFDLLLTDAFLVLASHYWNGRINPELIDPEWQAKRRDFDPTPVLRTALEGGDMRGTLQQLLPAAPEYAGLREALGRYRRLAGQGGWPQIPAGPRLSPGEQTSLVPLLRRRLELSGDYLPQIESTEQDSYDSQLVEALRHFQLRHGLNPDGVLGKGTLAALNVSAEQRVRQIEANLERWRWLPRDLGERYILVNIAAFQLYLVDGGEQILDMKVVVGKPYRRTPVFSGRMTYLVLNPYWNVPRKIAVEDFIPQMRKNPEYLSRLRIKIFKGWGAEAREIDPGTINWDQAAKHNFPYNLRQEPGEMNALGRIKFMFPNAHDVYLHDTPARELFLKESRSFSSGCIRLERPLDLAAYLLNDTAFGDRAKLEKALQTDKATSIKLPRAFPVHLLYWTAWVDSAGALQFRPDIYDRDGVLEEALSAGPPRT
jgi:L,D-transpeptidase YcbB